MTFREVDRSILHFINFDLILMMIFGENILIYKKYFSETLLKIIWIE